MLKAIIIISVILVAIYLISYYSWVSYTSKTSKELFSKASSKDVHVDFKELNTIPKVVQDYFNLVLDKNSSIINRAYIAQEGGFKIEQEKDSFLNTQAISFFSSSPIAFTWHAKISIGTGIYVNVFDSYIDSKAAMKVKFLSVYTMVNEHGKKELDKGALQRYLAEAVWFPTSLLPSQGVVWETVDEKRAKATLKDGNITVSLEFTFNDKGEITTIYSKDRFKEIDGKYIPTPWICRLSDYKYKEGYKIPMKGEVAWIIDGVESTYYKLEIQDAKYN